MGSESVPGQAVDGVEFFLFFKKNTVLGLGIGLTVGSLSNYEDDHNDDFKKTRGLMIKTTALQVHNAFYN